MHTHTLICTLLCAYTHAYMAVGVLNANMCVKLSLRHVLSSVTEAYNNGRLIAYCTSHCVCVCVCIFKQRPVAGFGVGMKLEAVDCRNPIIIRTATVLDVKEHRLQIHFDGWPSVYDYWVDDETSDIRPVGWCRRTGVMIEPPYGERFNLTCFRRRLVVACGAVFLSDEMSFMTRGVSFVDAGL